MWYRYWRLPNVGSVYVEYNKDLTSYCGYEWERGELFLYVRKIRMIITLPSWNYEKTKTRSGKRSGETGESITNIEGDRKVQRIGRRSTDTDRGSVSRSG